MPSIPVTRLIPLGLATFIVTFGSWAIELPAQTPKGNGQKSREEEVQLGSKTAKGGFQNEDAIRDKFNAWKTDDDARSWLQAMNYRLEAIEEVVAAKPHGEKADVEVRVKTQSGERVEGISIKLVSNPQGFNQIDKRWLKTYSQMWNMPDDVHEALKLFVGEVPPKQGSRDSRRMFLDELSDRQQQAVVDFFKTHRERIVSDLFAGAGEHSAGWIMVTLKEANGSSSPKQNATIDPQKTISSKQPGSLEKKPSWILCSSVDAVAFFGGGEVQITSAGSLKIGRITMQRKGGDNGRDTANMLQFKVNPTELFELK